MGTLIWFVIGAIFGGMCGVFTTALMVAARKSDEQGKLIHDADYERCVLCGKQTSVPVMMPVSERAYYIEGCGQLCAECYQKVYGGNTNG